MIFLFLVMAALFSVPMAYLLLWVARGALKPVRIGDPPWCEGCAYSLAGIEPGSPCPECGRASASLTPLDWKRRFGREGSAPWCGVCGYSMAGLSGLARCPECMGVKKKAVAWPSAWGVLVWMGLSQLPPLIGLARLSVLGSSGSGPSLEGMGFLLAVVLVPAAAALWVALVVSRAGVRWLSVATMMVVAGLPLVLCGAAVLSVGEPRGGGFFGPGFGLLLAIGVGPVVTALSLALFSVLAVLTAAVLEVQRQSRV